MATAVTVLCTNGRRVSVKVTPSTVLLQVLEEACRKQKLEPSSHTLKHRGKAVDLSALFRYTNIPKNAHLEMVPANRSQVSSEVVLAVQCADGSRHQEKFTDPNSTSLWDVLVKVGVVPAEGEPVVVYMNSQVCGEVSLRNKTLKDLGLSSGRAAIRFLTRPNSCEGVSTPQTVNETPKLEPTSLETSEIGGDVAHDTDSDVTIDVVPLGAVAMDTVPKETSDDEEPRPKPIRHDLPSDHDEYYSPAHPVSYFTDQSESREQPMETMLVETTEPPVRLVMPVYPVHQPVRSASMTTAVTTRVQYDNPCDRERMVYHLDNSLPLTPTDEISDEFFQVTHRDVQVMQEDLKKQRAMEDAPLLTEAMRQVVKEKRYETYERSVLRVHLPDRWVLQGVFRPRESLKSVVKFVRDNLADSATKFYLYTTPPKTVLKSGRPTLAEAGFVPAAIVYLGLEDPNQTTPLLSQECMECAQSALHAEMAVVGKRGSSSTIRDSRQPSSSSSISGPPNLSKSGPPSGERRSHVSAAIGKTVPKWFKLGK